VGGEGKFTDAPTHLEGGKEKGSEAGGWEKGGKKMSTKELRKMEMRDRKRERPETISKVLEEEGSGR